MKYKYTKYADSDTPLMLINKHIGDDAEEGKGIMGAEFVSELMHLDTLGKKRIDIDICSPGGSIFEGMLIYNGILTTNTKTDTIISGVAASIAGVISQAGDTRRMKDYALLMMHNPFDPTNEAKSPELDSFRGSLIKMLGRKNPKATEESISDLMNNTTWMHSEGKDGALELGYADIIEYSKDKNKPSALSASISPKAAWKTYTNYLNSIQKEKPKNEMKKIYGMLNLVDGSTDEVVMNAITAIQNKVTVAEKAEKEAKDGLDKANTSITDLQNKITVFEDAAKTAKAEADKVTATALENASNLLVDGYVKVGKIKNDVDTIKNMKAMAIRDFEGFKGIYDAMPLNKVGADIIKGVENPKGVVKHTMGGAMVVINNRAK